MATFYVSNFGCRATQADGAAIENQFRERGLARADHPDEAEIVVLNTCTVTAAADRDARASVRHIHRKNPHAQIVVTGCYAQRAPGEVASLPGVSSVVGNSHKHKLAEIALAGAGASVTARAVSDIEPEDQSGNSSNVENFPNTFVPLSNLIPRLAIQARSPIFVSDIFAHTELQAAPVFDASNARTRPNLKVQDGCDNRCSFCVIPYVRGQSRSLRLAEIIRQVESLVNAGYREVVISGINLGRWGRDLAGRSGARPQGFEDLVRALLSETALEKLRISSVEPMDWSDALIELIATSPRIAKHAHVPLQSGSDTVLRRMHRKYRPWHYREKIEAIRTAMPAAAIGADVMVGFPGETDVEFDQTRRLIEDLPFTYLHVFTYSARPGTPAASLPAHVPVAVTGERNRILRHLAFQKKLAFMEQFVGKPLEAITLNSAGDHQGQYTAALTDNYLPMQVLGNHSPNRWVTAKVLRVADETLTGSIG